MELEKLMMITLFVCLFLGLCNHMCDAVPPPRQGHEIARSRRLMMKKMMGMSMGGMKTINSSKSKKSMKSSKSKGEKPLFCPGNAIEVLKFYVMEIVVESKATVCDPGELEELSGLLKSLVDITFSNFVAASDTRVCTLPDDVPARRRLPLEDSQHSNGDLESGRLENEGTSNANDEHVSRQLQWGRFTYRGGAKCLFCYGDNADQRARMLTSSSQGKPCQQSDVIVYDRFFSISDFQGQDRGRSLLPVHATVPHKSDLIKVFLDVSDEGMIWGTIEELILKVNEKSYKIKHLKANGQIKAYEDKNRVSWATKSERTPYGRRTRFVFHLPPSFLSKKRFLNLEIEVVSKELNLPIGFDYLQILARQYCSVGNAKLKKREVKKLTEIEKLEKSLSEHLADGIEEALRSESGHCMYKKKPTAFVNLYAAGSWPEANPICNSF